MLSPKTAKYIFFWNGHKAQGKLRLLKRNISFWLLIFINYNGDSCDIYLQDRHLKLAGIVGSFCPVCNSIFSYLMKINKF